ncbi:GntR family transcriptional regulator [Ensifer sp. ENS09]|uniref:GntR family transcriptional regulator n=1 Tax=Ensifer sp. ENS09 TaxID=2769263 RepID=UPI00178251CF|nr:GntR family transcriptional regulator [Ensifer sp. ENS09]MBD9650049.1 GntR family transcriptional regulator [Ensifer sp. ENS09]
MSAYANQRSEPLIERNHPDPLYIQLRNLLKAKIDQREWATNEKLPSERELVTQYSVSRITVRQALKELEHLGYLQSRPGKGIYVSEPKPSYELEIVRSFTQTAIENRLRPSMRLLTGEVIKAGEEIARSLSLPVGAEVVYLERLRLLNDLPVVVQRDWFSAGMTPGILKLDWTAENRSLYSEFEQTYGVFPARGQSTVSARLATDAEAELLQMETPAAVLTLDQVAYDATNRTVNISAAAYHPLRYPLTLTQMNHRR